MSVKSVTQITFRIEDHTDRDGGWFVLTADDPSLIVEGEDLSEIFEDVGKILEGKRTLRLFMR